MKPNTIIVILLVVCLIAILLALIIPAQNKADPLTPTMRARNKIGSIMVACFNYTADNEGKLPLCLENIPEKSLSRELMYIENPKSNSREKWLYFNCEKWAKGSKKILLASPFPLKEGENYIRFVGYTDQSVEKIKEKEFLKLLEKNNKTEQIPQK